MRETSPFAAGNACLPFRNCPATCLQALGLGTVLLLGVSCSSNCPRGEPAAQLRLVPVPAEAVPEDQQLPEELRLGEGEAVSRQTWSLAANGEFSFTRSIETEVGYLGIEPAALDAKAAKRLGLAPYTGILVRSVKKRGPASQAGVVADDVVLAFAGEPVRSVEQLDWLVVNSKPGETAELLLSHGGEIRTIEVVTGKESRIVKARAFQRRLPLVDDLPRTGLKLVELTDEVRPFVLGRASQEKGLLVVELLPGGPAFHSKLRQGDVLVSVSGSPVPEAGVYSAVLEAFKPGDEVKVAALRRGMPIETSIRLARDATARRGFNLLGLIKYDSRPRSSELELIWGLLLDAGSSAEIREKEDTVQHWKESKCGLVLDLLAYRRTCDKSELRLLWLFPLTFYSR